MVVSEELFILASCLLRPMSRSSVLGELHCLKLNCNLARRVHKVGLNFGGSCVTCRLRVLGPGLQVALDLGPRPLQHYKSSVGTV